MLSHHYQNPGLPYQRENIVEQKEYVGKSETLLITLHSAESRPWCFGFDGSQTMSDAPLRPQRALRNDFGLVTIGVSLTLARPQKQRTTAKICALRNECCIHKKL